MRSPFSGYVLVAILKKLLKLDQSLYSILQIISVSLFEKTLLNQGFFKTNDTVLEDQVGKPLSLFDS